MHVCEQAVDVYAFRGVYSYLCWSRVIGLIASDSHALNKHKHMNEQQHGGEG